MRTVAVSYTHLETAEDRNEVTFVLESPDGDQGFPGNLKLEVTYALTDDCLLYTSK